LTVEWNDRHITRFVKSGAGYLSSFDPRLLITLPDAHDETPVKVRVNWEGSGEQVFEDLPTNETHVLIEGPVEK
jgi:hypothetical protein